MTLGPGWLARSIFSYVLLYSRMFFFFLGGGGGLSRVGNFLLGLCFKTWLGTQILVRRS